MAILTGCVSVQLSVPRNMHVEAKISHTERCHHSTPAHTGAHTHLHTRPAQACHSLLSLATLVLERVQGGLSPPPLPSPPQAAPPLRKYSSGVPRATQEMLCVLWVSQAIFCPRTGGRLGREQPRPTYSAVLTFSMVASTVGSGPQWVVLGLSASRLAPSFSLKRQDSSFDANFYIFQSSAEHLLFSLVSLTLPNHFVIPFSEHSPAVGEL